MESTNHPTLQNLDWVVIGLYFLGMLTIGWYFSRRNLSRADYLLGGRRMKSWMVGVSLFASMFSVIGYISMPGEIIKNGPMYWTGLVCYPLVFLIVGYLLIPAITKLPVSSAYEILERRLDVKVRLFASTLFLMLRIIWMAMIIYTAAQKIIIPIMHWPAESAFWVSAVIGGVTLIYTSMGGIRAVVFTDVIQAFILFIGAILTLILITVQLGGPGEWFPSRWPEHWVKWTWYDPQARISFGTTFTSIFCWWVFTAGSDQIAIQRYLSTRDTRSARKAFLLTLITDILATLFLALVGMALLGYYMKKGDVLIPGETLENCADKLFPAFIVAALPAGLTGLVVAGLLSAAMSCLSAGINSSCLVITHDFFTRFRKTELSESRQVRLARVVSLLVGLTAVCLSFLANYIRGNLFEICYKCVNLFVAPLFVPFFMALFIRRARSGATIIGMAAAIITAFLISFSQELYGQTISFIWIMPTSFACGVLVGTILSLLSRSPIPPTRCDSKDYND
jgi:solute:Na+ symporter, SSS family